MQNLTDLMREMRHVRRQLDRIELALRRVTQQEYINMAISSDLQQRIDAARAQINRQTTVEDSNRELLQHLVQMINDLKNTTSDPDVLAAIDDLTNSITQNTDALAADVAANTPAQPTT